MCGVVERSSHHCGRGDDLVHLLTAIHAVVDEQQSDIAMLLHQKPLYMQYSVVLGSQQARALDNYS